MPLSLWLAPLSPCQEHLSTWTLCANGVASVAHQSAHWTLVMQSQSSNAMPQNFAVPSASSGPANEFQWRLVNGLWGFILAVGLLWTALTVRKARSWLYFRGWARSLLADYGVPLLVVIWSAVGYCIYKGTPNGVPMQAIIYNTWDVKNNWSVARVSSRLRPALFTTGSSDLLCCQVCSARMLISTGQMGGVSDAGMAACAVTSCPVFAYTLCIMKSLQSSSAKSWCL